MGYRDRLALWTAMRTVGRVVQLDLIEADFDMLLSSNGMEIRKRRE